MELSLVRIDSRLIHGQVVTKWLKQTEANTFLIVDDLLAQDEFMASVYQMAAPSDTPVIIKSVEDIVSDWKENKFEDKKFFVLFKDVQMTYQAFQQGFPLEAIQIGGLGSGPDKKQVSGPIYLNEKEIDLLNEMAEAGVEITLQQVPEEPSLSLEKALNRIK